MKKWMLSLLVLIMAACFDVQLYAAEVLIPAKEPLVQDYRPFIEIPEVRSAGAIEIVCDKEPVLGEEGTWRITTPFNSYQFLLAEDTGENEVPAMYSTDWTSDNSFTYTIREPGNYILFYYGRMEDENPAYSYIVFSVAPRSGVETVSGKVDEIAAECLQETDGTDYAKALWLHDWIIEHAYYDNGYNFYGPDGILFHQTGVCDSYSKLYELLLTEVGIPSCRVANNGHAWNAVYLEGEWCHIDVTWDDPDPDTGGSAMISGRENHDYFGLNDECIQKVASHSFDQNAYDFRCTSLKNSYNYRNGKYKIWLYFAMEEIERSLEEGLLSFDAAVQDGMAGAEVDENGDCISAYGGAFADQLLGWGARYLSEDMHLLLGRYNVQVDFEYDAEAQMVHAQVDLEPLMMNLPEDTLVVEEEAFANDESILALRIPEGASEIGARAFAGCSNLIALEIPESVAQISAASLEGLPSYTTIICGTGSAAEAAAKELGCRTMEYETSRAS